MIVYINTRLNEWADWSIRRESNGLGYPRECSYTRMQARSGAGFAPETNERAWEVEQAVQSLGDVSKQVIIEMYLKTGTAEQKARSCQCCARTMFNRLHHAHVLIMEFLNMYEESSVKPAVNLVVKKYA